MKKTILITSIILISVFLSSFFGDGIDEKIEEEFEKLDCVKIAWVYQESGIWNAWLICDKGEDNFHVHESSFFKYQLKNKVSSNLERHTFCK